MNRRGFTLIELLVVIAIIAVLAAILFPVFARAREKARQTYCLNNAKNLGNAFRQYSQDFDEKMPFASADNTSGPLSLKWWDLVFNYVRNNNIYGCPSASPASGAVTYSYNLNIGRYGVTGGGTHLHDIPDPCRTILLNEQINFPRQLGEQQLAGFAFREWPYPQSNVYYWCEWTLPHNEGCNLTFCDGHAKWFKMLGRSHPYDPTTTGTPYKIPGIFIMPDRSR